MPDIKRSLTRQSLAVAGVCVATDVGLFLVLGVPLDSGWQAWLVLAAVIVADAAFALPARYSGFVALEHAVLVVGSFLLLAGWDGMKAPNNSGLLIAGYLAGAWLRTPQALLILGALAGSLVATYVLVGRYSADWRLLVFAGVIPNAVLPWLVGRYTTARRAYLADLEAEAELRRRDERVAIQRAVAEERSAIARDLHDMISHHVSAISMHAGAARLAGVADGPARRSLAEVESASRSAMVDLRRMLDLLHGQDRGANQPGLDNLDELLDGVRAAGFPVRMAVHGTPVAVPGSLDIALYRIVQEALTNALRHGDGAVEVEVSYRDDRLTMAVTNETGPGATRKAGPHLGLKGIRHRVAVFGGEVSYGPDGGRWRTVVSFPLERSPVPTPEGT